MRRVTCVVLTNARARRSPLVDAEPQNLLLSDSGPDARLVIADFGFARYVQPHGMAETLCGSPLYMAPEILRFQKYDAKADLWSVGAVLYELLVGRTPYTGANHVQLLRNIEKQDVQIPTHVVLSPACVQVIMGLLRRNPVERMSHEDLFGHPFVSDSAQTPAQQARAGSGQGNALGGQGHGLGGSVGSGGSSSGGDCMPFALDEGSGGSSGARSSGSGGAAGTRAGVGGLREQLVPPLYGPGGVGAAMATAQGDGGASTNADVDAAAAALAATARVDVFAAGAHSNPHGSQLYGQLPAVPESPMRPGGPHEGGALARAASGADEDEWEVVVSPEQGSASHESGAPQPAQTVDCRRLHQPPPPPPPPQQQQQTITPSRGRSTSLASGLPAGGASPASVPLSTALQSPAQLPLGAGPFSHGGSPAGLPGALPAGMPAPSPLPLPVPVAAGQYGLPGGDAMPSGAPAPAAASSPEERTRVLQDGAAALAALAAGAVDRGEPRAAACYHLVQLEALSAARRIAEQALAAASPAAAAAAQGVVASVTADFSAAAGAAECAVGALSEGAAGAGVQDDAPVADPLEVAYEGALASGREGAAEELMERHTRAAAAYGRAVAVLTMLATEGSTLAAAAAGLAKGAGGDGGSDGSTGGRSTLSTEARERMLSYASAIGARLPVCERAAAQTGGGRARSKTR